MRLFASLTLPAADLVPSTLLMLALAKVEEPTWTVAD